MILEWFFTSSSEELLKKKTPVRPQNLGQDYDKTGVLLFDSCPSHIRWSIELFFCFFFFISCTCIVLSFFFQIPVVHHGSQCAFGRRSKYSSKKNFLSAVPVNPFDIIFQNFLYSCAVSAKWQFFMNGNCFKMNKVLFMSW